MRKKNNAKIIILVFCVILFGIGIVYSVLRQDLNIIGKANIDIEDYIVTYKIEDKWQVDNNMYYRITMTLFNNTDYVLNGWKISMSAPENVIISNYASINCSINEKYIIMENVSYNEQILSKSSTSFEIQISTTDLEYKPSNITVNDKGTSKPEIPSKPEENEKNAKISFNKDNSWQSGEYYYYQITATVENIGTNIINSWEFDINILEDSDIEQIWNANYIKNNNIYTFENSIYNGNIQLNSNITFGFIIKIKNNNLDLKAENIILN